MDERGVRRGRGGTARTLAAACLLVAASALVVPLGHGPSDGPAGQRDTDPVRALPAGAEAGPVDGPPAGAEAGPVDGPPAGTKPGAAGGLPTGAGTGAAGEAAQECADPEASLPPSAADGPTIHAIKARGKLVVGVDQNSYRWGYRNPATGTLEGFDIDLARAIAADVLGSPDAVILRAVPTNQRIAALRSGKVDLVVRTMTINCARARQVAFSTAYFATGQQVLAPEDSPITGYDGSLAGKRVCSAEGSTAYEALERRSYGAVYRDEHDGTPRDPDRYTVPNQLDCLVRLQAGEVDAVVTDSALAAGQAAQDPAVELKGAPFTTEYYGVAAGPGRDDLVRRVNHVLVAYRAGPWTRAYERWLKADLPGISGPPAPEYRTNPSP